MVASRHHGIICDAHLVFIQDGKVLLGLRSGGGFGSGKYNVPAGHHEEGEAIDESGRREAREELGVAIPPGGMQLAHVMHHRESDERMSLFFIVTEWDGELINQEPDKCTELKWVPLDALPDNTLPYCREAITAIVAGQCFSSQRYATDRTFSR